MEGVKLTLCVLSWLKLQKKWQSFNPFSDNEELQHNELDPDVNYYLDEIYFSLSFSLSLSLFLSRDRSNSWNPNEADIIFWTLLIHYIMNASQQLKSDRLKCKKHLTPLITGGIKKSSKRKQKLCEKFKNIKLFSMKKNIKPTKTCLNRLSGSQRKATFRSKYYSTKIIWKKRGVSWMKEIISKMHQDKSKLPRKLFIYKKYITLEIEISKKFHEFFTEIGLSLQVRFLLQGSLLKVSWKKPAPPYL